MLEEIAKEKTTKKKMTATTRKTPKRRLRSARSVRKQRGRPQTQTEAPTPTTPRLSLLP